MLKHLQKCCITLDVTGVKFEVVTLSEFETSRDVTKLLDVATPFVLLLGVALRRNATGAVATLLNVATLMAVATQLALLIHFQTLQKSLTQCFKTFQRRFSRCFSDVSTHLVSQRNVPLCDKSLLINRLDLELTIFYFVFYPFNYRLVKFY